MKLSRDLSGENLSKKLSTLGYRITRQTGSHLRLTTQEKGEHHITIPNHQSLRVGTLSSILVDVAKHFGFGRDELMKQLFSK